MAHQNKARKAAAKEAKEAREAKMNKVPQNLLNEEIEYPSPSEWVQQIIKKTLILVRRMTDLVMKDFGGNDFVDSVASWCARNPHMAIVLMSAALAFLIPFLVVLGFGVATILMTLTGVLVLEGTLFTIVTLVFIACVGGFAIMLPLLGVATVAAILGLSQVCGAYNETGCSNFITRLITPPSRYEENSSVTISEEPTDTPSSPKPSP